LIYLYKITAGSSPPKVTLHSKLTFHQKGVQSLAFSNDSKYLISVAVQGENVLAVWDIEQGLVIKSALIRQHSVNQIKVDPYIEDTHLQFCTVGNQGAFTFWRLDLAG
jgi:WD40 repeat protein